jgi:tRNA A37 methylthiotransferase MiaB
MQGYSARLLRAKTEIPVQHRSSSMKRAYCIDLGCSENALDGAVIRHHLQDGDYELVQRPEDADLIIVNTCGFTNRHAQLSLKTYQHLMAIKRPETRVIFAGCLPAIDERAIRSAGYRDLLITPRTLPVLTQITGAQFSDGESAGTGCAPSSTDKIGPSFRSDYSFYQNIVKQVAGVLRVIPLFPIPRWLWQFLYLPDQSVEFVRISIGCMNQCTFCAIRRAKGTTRSVPADVIIERIQDALRRGKDQISLSCDEFASWGQDIGDNIVTLMNRVSSLKGEYHLILRNVHPEWLLKYWEDLRPIFRRQKVSYMVMPLQSGSDKILRLMKRNHTSREYRWLIDQIRETCPHLILRTHLVVGFPGESEADFRDTCRFVGDLPVDSFWIHRYSEAVAIPSASLPDKVPEEIIDRRAKALERLGRKNFVRKYRWLPLRP